MQISITQYKNLLEQKGYIKRERSIEDERVLVVTVTESGEELKEAALAVPAQIGSCVKLSPEEAQTLYALLYKVLGGITEERTE